MYYRGLSRKVSREKNNCLISENNSDMKNNLICERSPV
jgi:hypothetical protein